MQHNLALADSSKKKTVVVVILALVFIVIVSSKFSSGPHEAPATTVATQLPPVSVASNLSVKLNGTSDSPPNRFLPPIDLSRIVTNNPFLDTRKIQRVDHPTSASPIRENQGEPPAEDASVENPQPTVEAVVTGGRKPAALINDKLHFEKDVVDQRWVIEEILPQTVIFKPLRTESSKP